MIAAPSLRCGSAAWTMKNIEKMFDWKVRFNCSSVMSRDVLVGMLLAGIVDQHVEPPEGVDHLLDRGVAERLVAKVAGNEDRAAAFGFDDLLGLFGVVMLAQIEDRDVGAFASVERGDGAADPAVGAGDDRDLALEPVRSRDSAVPIRAWG